MIWNPVGVLLFGFWTGIASTPLSPSLLPTLSTFLLLVSLCLRWPDTNGNQNSEKQWKLISVCWLGFLSFGLFFNTDLII